MSPLDAVEPIARALAWTVIHSLWQLALVAALLFALLRRLADAAPEARYRACLGGLGLSLLLPTATFVRFLARPATEVDASFVGLSSLAAPFDVWLPWVAGGWLVGVLLLLSRLFLGWRRLERLVRAARVDLALADVVNRLSRQLGVRRMVRVLVAPGVDVPATVGWLKPVLLLPIGLANGLTPRQVESILAHELAHVRRYDFLVNVVTTLVESLLFHHPAIWWISRRLRVEREFCCDDLAVVATGRARDVASALAALEVRRQGLGSLTMSANGGSLMIRIRRLIEPRPATQAGRPLVVASAGAALLAVAAFAAPSVACDEKQKIRVVVSELPATIEIEVVAAPESPEMSEPSAAPTARRRAVRVIEGVVVDVDGRPIEGAILRIRPSGAGGPPSSLESDVDGHVTWPAPRTFREPAVAPEPPTLWTTKPPKTSAAPRTPGALWTTKPPRPSQPEAPPSGLWTTEPSAPDAPPVWFAPRAPKGPRTAPRAPHDLLWPSPPPEVEWPERAPRPEAPQPNYFTRKPRTAPSAPGPSTFPTKRRGTSY